MQKHRCDEIYRNLTTKVIAVFTVDIDVFHANSAGACYASIAPISVVVCHRGVCTAFNMKGKVKSLEKLCDLIPELKQYL